MPKSPEPPKPNPLERFVRVVAERANLDTAGMDRGGEFYGSGVVLVEASEAEVAQALQRCLSELSPGKTGGNARPALSSPDGGRRGD